MMNESKLVRKHKDEMDELYKNPKYGNAISLWASSRAESEDDIIYSNWRYSNKKRQRIENRIWRKYIKNGFNILDIACGEGYFLKRIYDALQSDNIGYYGLDISQIIINVAKIYFPLANYVVSCAEKTSFQDNQFDYIQIVSGLEYVMNPGDVIEEAVRILKPGGILCIVIHKHGIDPLIFPTFLQAIKNKLRKLFGNKEDNRSVRYTFMLSDCRKAVFCSLDKNNMVPVEKGFLAGYIEHSFYRLLGIPVNWFIAIAKLANMLPSGLFKDLEYCVYRKKE